MADFTALVAVRILCHTPKGSATMLVLSRRQGEDVIIAGNIRLRVVAVEGNKVRLGITAPSTVPIVRGELRHGAEDVRPADPPGPKARRRRIISKRYDKRPSS